MEQLLNQVGRVRAEIVAHLSTMPDSLEAALDALESSAANLQQQLTAAHAARSQIENQWHAYTAQIRHGFQHAPMTLVAFDASGVLTLCEGAPSLLPGDPTTLIGQSIFALFPQYAADQERARRALTGEAVHWTATYGTRIKEVWLTPILDGHGIVQSVVALIKDVTELARTEQELRAREALLQQVIGTMPIILAVLDSQGLITLLAGAGMASLQLSTSLMGQSVSAAFADLPESLAHARRALGGEAIQWTESYRGRVLDLHAEPVIAPDDGVQHVFVLGVDVTERVQAEQALREREALLRGVITRTPIILYALNCEGTITFTDGQGLALIGETPGQTVGQSIFDLRRDDPIELDAVRRALSGETVAWISAEPPFFDSWVVPMRDAAGAIAGAIGVAIDVTERKQAEQALRESELRLRQVVEHAPIILFAIDHAGIITLSEGKGLTLIGETPGQSVGQQIREAWRPYPTDLAAIDRALAGEEVVWVGDGPPYFESRLVPIRDAAGQVLGALGVGVDVTDRMRAEAERRDLERKLMETQRLESLGILAGGIAHDFNNLLQSILGTVEGALQDMDASEEMSEVPIDAGSRMNVERIPAGPSRILHPSTREALEPIRTITQRAAALTQQLLAYAGLGRVSIEPLDLGALVGDAVNLLRTSIPATAELNLQIAEALPAIVGDATQIRQVVMNLVLNGAEALPEGAGRVTITIARQTLIPAAVPGIVVGRDLPAGSYVALTVADSGAGLDQATRARIFEPFFTTKFTGRGLGLAAVLGIVRGHGGGLALTSTLGIGSTFTVFFQPSSAPVRVPARETEPTTVPWRGQGTVLVADDDPSVRDIAARHLRRMGFTTLIASNGEAAVEMFQTHRDEIVCVLLDRTMPKMDGIAAAQAIWMVDPSMPIVMMSGYNEAEGRSSPPMDRLGGFLHKPFAIDQLREMLRRTLDG